MLYIDGGFCLTDLPALNWTATPLLSKDPVAHTLRRGKRFLCNDLWGLGLLTLNVLAGHRAFDQIKQELRDLKPTAPASAAPHPGSKRIDYVSGNWLVVSLYLLVELEEHSHYGKGAAHYARVALRSSWLVDHVGAIAAASYREQCQSVARRLREAIVRPTAVEEEEAAQVMDCLSYCLDVTDLARNALCIPLT